MHLSRLMLALALAVGPPACSDTPTSPSDTTSLPPHTVVFTSTVTPNGSSSRTFTAGGPGTVTLTLTASPGGVPLGIGVGLSTASRTGCSLTRSVTASPSTSPHLQVTVDAGAYCVQVSDVTGLPEMGAFTLTFEHP